eukprot:CAMPEP_0113459490 /NCGR_PEP_ID=MMETSP0014_2-20120614/10480_1 /TAXON_ID=2857 /ORGANISM="Nitzschia sp." /LENGTH=679 /DNA_ID=CAMNT_0000351077 /DNA_START=41 /DNA_END=2080 /DNA_ORIENTATION=- /assembly_acc=CAM_ASM_000159
MGWWRWFLLRNWSSSSSSPGGRNNNGGIVYVVYLLAVVVSVIGLSFQQYHLLLSSSGSSQTRNENDVNIAVNTIVVTTSDGIVGVVPTTTKDPSTFSSSSSSSPLPLPPVPDSTDTSGAATAATVGSAAGNSSSNSTNNDLINVHHHEEEAKKKEDSSFIEQQLLLQPRVWNIWPSKSKSLLSSSSSSSSSSNNNSSSILQVQQQDERYLSFPCADPDKHYSSVAKDKDHKIYPLGRNCRPNCPTEGLLFTKPYKTGSSTVSGIVIQISKNIAGRYYNYNNVNQTTQQQQLANKSTSTSNVNTTPLSSSSLVLKPCQSSYMHSEGRQYHHRHTEKSFLLSILRHPTHRAISEFYHFHVTRRNIPATLDSFRKLIRADEGKPAIELVSTTKNNNGSNNTTTTATSKTKRTIKMKRSSKTKRRGDDLCHRTRNFYLHHHVWNKTEQILLNNVDEHDDDDDSFAKVLHQNKKKKVTINNNNNVDEKDVVLQQVAQGIIRDYDFIAITERFDESMVVLQMLLRNVTLGDILYLSAKTNGGYDDGRFQDKCFKIISPRHNMTQDFHDYFSNDDDEQQQQSPYHNEWSKRIKWDLELYKAANRSLDLTIDNVLGRTEFENQQRRFREAQQIVHDRCAPIAKFPCSPQGQVRTPDETNCLFKDSGCAYECIDEVAKELNLYVDDEY